MPEVIVQLPWDWRGCYLPDLSEEDRPYFEHGAARRIRNAKDWIRGHITLIQGFPPLEALEIAAKMYPDTRALCDAWFEEFGGI